MTTLYHSIVYDRTMPVQSYWDTTLDRSQLPSLPLQQDLSCDVAIIGGGITGLSAALHLAHEHQIQACVLEAGPLAWGASGRNGGFCCVGSTRLSNQALLKQFGREETRRYFQDQQEATELVRQLAIAQKSDIEAQGDGEIVSAHSASRWVALEEEHEFLTEIAQYPCQLWTPQEVTEYAFHSPESYGALHVGVGFGLNPLKYTYMLAQAAHRQGATLFPHSPVTVWEKSGAWHQLHTPRGTVRAKTVIITTNGYTEDTLHAGLSDRFLPVLSNIITTRPLTQKELEAQGWHTETPIYDTRHLLFYYRLLKDGRFLFGSRGGTVGDRSECDRHRRWMTRRLGDMFPAWKTVEITHFWNGLVCLSAALTPHIGALAEDSSVFYALAYHGNGVAMGTWSGRAIAHVVARQTQIQDLCAVVRQPLKTFPLPALRVWYLRAAYSLYRVKDALPS